MYWSKSFIPTSKENPSGAKIPSHQLLIRAGMIKQESAGIYSWLPLGFKVLKNIESIVREEQEAAGAVEILMPTLQSSDLWIESGRYEGYGEEMLRISDRHDADLIYGPTNEEQITVIDENHEEENQEQISLESLKNLENLEETNCESNYLKISNDNHVFNTKKNSNQINQYIKTPKLPLPNIKNLRKWINKDKKAS